jgi:hypothetical protein
MRQLGDIGVPKDRDAVFVHRSPRDLLSVPISPFGVFKRLLRMLLSGLMILLLVGLGGVAVRVGGGIVQFAGSLVILVM